MAYKHQRYDLKDGAYTKTGEPFETEDGVPDELMPQEEGGFGAFEGEAVIGGGVVAKDIKQGDAYIRLWMPAGSEAFGFADVP